MVSSSYDIIIVGGGTAGLALASRLSEDENLQVVVVESGEDRRADPKVLSPGMWPLLSHDPSDWVCKTVPQESFLNSVDTFPLGRMLGGCSGINSFLFTPTSQKNVDAWAQLGNKGWDYASFDKSLKKSYTFHSPTGAVEGNGPIQLRVTAHESEPQAAWTEAWRDSIDTLGFSPQDPFSGQVCGSFNNPESIDPATRQRSFSANAYLGAAKDRTNLTVITGAAVTKILLSTSNPDGVVAEGIQITQTMKDGKTDTTIIRARREVILCGGAVNSPRLLELSGIGDGNLLKNLGIEVVLNNPHVGENLQNHVYTGVVFEVSDDANVSTLDPFFRSDPQVVGAAMEAYSTTGFGPLGSSSILATAQLPFPGILTEDGKQDIHHLLQEHLDVKPHAASTSTSAFAAAHEHFVKSVLSSRNDASANYVLGPAYTEFESREDPGFRATGNYITVAVMLSHPLSRGSVHITTPTPDGLITGSSTDLAIDPRYFSHPLDLEVLARHIRFAEQAIGKAEPLVRLLKPRVDRFGDLDAAREYIRKTARGAHHYTGTCAMMPRELGGVVGRDLRVHGCLNLRVCDASIVPIAPRGNTQAVVYGVAEMGAGLIRESLWRGKV